MKPFQLDSSMKTLGGTFYPKGWMVLMFPSEQVARDAAKKLADAHVPGDVMLVTPQDLRTHILSAAGDDEILPSAGSEGDTVRRFAEMAAQGHYGLMVHAPSHDDSERVMQALQGVQISYGQKYRMLVIEDVVT
jgi:hypothetical protein